MNVTDINRDSTTAKIKYYIHFFIIKFKKFKEFEENLTFD